MILNIEEQVPETIKVFSNYQIAIPINVREVLGWKSGDRLELYATTKGLFLKKKEE